MAAISKREWSVRPLHDATHSAARYGTKIWYQDKILYPGLLGIAAMSKKFLTLGRLASVSELTAAALVKVHRSDWGCMCYGSNSSFDMVRVNCTGTFGVPSAVGKVSNDVW